MLQFIARIAGHRVCRQAVQAVLGQPMLRTESGDLKLNRYSRPSRLLDGIDVGIDAGGECFENRLGVGCIARVLRIQIAAVAQAPRVDVALDCAGTEYFCKPPLT